MSVCEIIPNLWLGDIRSAKNKHFFDENGINVIINCSKDIPFYSNYGEKIRIAVNDDLKRDEIDKMYQYLPKVTDLIQDKLEKNNKILVHCYAGKQRSASVIVGYLMKYGNLSMKNAILAVQSKRLIAFTPGINFDNALKQFENDLVN